MGSKQGNYLPYLFISSQEILNHRYRYYLWGNIKVEELKWKNLPVKKEDISDCLRICQQQNYFQLNNDIFVSIDGLIMRNDKDKNKKDKELEETKDRSKRELKNFWDVKSTTMII